MRKIYIKYNPYKVETEITIDGKMPKKNSALNVEDKRIQEWIEDLPDILFDECGTKEFELIFKGTVLDYEDVLSMAKDAKNKGIMIECNNIQAKEVKDKEQAIKEIFQEIQMGPFDELRQPDMIKAFELANSSDFEVNVVATMSAGKSTLINSLLQQKLMPAKQEACTATITKIKDNDVDEGKFRAAVYDLNGGLIQSHPELTFDIMETLNKNENVSTIKVEGNIPFVNSDDISLVLVDTPGPNNSRDPEHKVATYRMLSESSKTVVLYILNATQLAVNDDNDLLNHVADSMRIGGKQSKDRFIFVVNKLDEFKQGEDSVKAAITKVRDYLKDKGIENANIFPASALTALNIRTVLSQSDDDDDDVVYETKGKVRKFNRTEEMHFENYASLTPSVRGEIAAELAVAKANNDVNAAALIHTGIVPIEAAIKMYVEKYAKTAKIKNIVDTFSKKLESAKSFENVKQEIALNEDKKKEILAAIKDINNKLKDGEKAKKFKAKIDKINYDAEIKKISNSVITEAQKKISLQLSSNGIDGKKLSKVDAKNICDNFSRFSDNLQAEVQIKLEDMVTNHIKKNAEDLLNQYNEKINNLSSEINVCEIKLNPFEMMEGDISTDTTELIANLTKKENVKIGRQWIENTDKKWYKPWTWLDEKGYYKDIYEDKEYVNGKELSEHFFAPIQEALYENAGSGVEYAKKQTCIIKIEFSKKFNELDKVLENKLAELKVCAKDNLNAEKLVKESEARLEWLENIKNKIKAILDI